MAWPNLMSKENFELEQGANVIKLKQERYDLSCFSTHTEKQQFKFIHIWVFMILQQMLQRKITELLKLEETKVPLSKSSVGAPMFVAHI